MKSLTAIIRQCNQIGATERLVKKGPIKSFGKKKTIKEIKQVILKTPNCGFASQV